MDEIVIVGAARTPIGKLGGGLAGLPAHELGALAMSAALERAGVAPAEVTELVMGQVLNAGAGQNPARQAALKAGMRVDSTAYGVNQVCGSGLRAVALAAQGLAQEPEAVMVAGGQESMSQAPHFAHLRRGSKFGDVSLADTVLHDGLIDAMQGGHMGWHTENLARARGIGRDAQEAFALASQQKAVAAQQAGLFQQEIVPVAGAEVVAVDEAPRPGLTLAALQRLPAAFQDGGSVTAGTASGLNDGAAALVLTTASHAARRGLEPLARIVSFATAGVEPGLFGLGPVPASRLALQRAGWRIQDLDLAELNEAYSVQSLAVMADLDLDPAKVNVHGGAIALGHPLGASGARVLVTLLYALRQRGGRRGLAALCIGGGMGVAMCVELL